MKFSHSYTRFTSGEWSPKMYSRTDTDQYNLAARSLKNMIPQLQGGAFRRGGFQYVNLGTTFNALLAAATDFTLIPYKPSFESVSYVIVCLDGSPSNRWIVVNTTTGASNYLNSVPTSDANFDAGTNTKFMQYAQVGDVCVITSQSGPRRFLYKQGSNFILSTTFPGERTENLWRNYPYTPERTNNEYGYISVTGTLSVGGSVTVTSSVTLFNSSFVGTYIKVSSATGNSTGVVQVTGYTSGTIVTGTVIVTVPGTSGSLAFGQTYDTAYQFQAWRADIGWPKCVTSFQGRIIYGNTFSDPTAIWGTQISNFANLNEIPLFQDNIYTGFTDDNSRPFEAKPNSPEVSSIQSLSASKSLLINGDNAEIVAYGSRGALGPLDINFETSTSFGSEFVQARRVNNFATFVQRGGRVVRDIVFSFNEDQYKSGNLSFVSDHLFPEGDYIKQLAHVEASTSIMFAVTNDGLLRGCSLDREYEVNAWFPIVPGGTGLGPDNTPQVKSICGVPFFRGTTDLLYAIIDRVVAGFPVRTLERLIPIYEKYDLDTVNGDFHYQMDSWVQSTGVYLNDATTFGGIAPHLLDSAVDVYFSGVYAGRYTLDNGDLTVPASILSGIDRSDIILGLPYESIFEPLSLEHANNFGSPVGRMKKIDEVIIRFWNSMYCEYGNPITDEFFPVELNPGAGTGTVPKLLDLFSGQKVYKFPNGYAKDYRIQIKTDKPYPVNILSVTVQGITHD